MPEMTGSSLDPEDWKAFGDEAHRLLDVCLDHLEQARSHPWRPVDDDVKRRLRIDDGSSHEDVATVVNELVDWVLPFSTGNTHPTFFGWVHGTGLASGLLAEIVAATMNSNCGGRDHGAVYVEREVIDWCRRTFGFPDGASGVLVSGTSQATVIALGVARTKALGRQSRRDGIQGAPRLTAYASQGVHHAVVKAMELLGIGAAALRLVPSIVGRGMDIERLEQMIAADREQGFLPFCVIGTAGSVDFGEFDDLDALADVAGRSGLWLHVDGAFGAWARLADPPWSLNAQGIDRADSIAFDFHKWMYVQYDCGAVLVRDGNAHRAAFAARPAYLATQSRGLGGGEPWFCDYGIDLSRGFRALKVWVALRLHGRERFGQAITRNCELARTMGALVEATGHLRPAYPVRLNVCCFSAAPPAWTGEAQDAFNAMIAEELQLHHGIVFSTTRVDERTVLRAAIVNHRTCHLDIERTVATVAEIAKDLSDRPGAGD